MKKIILATLLIGIMGGCKERNVNTKPTSHVLGNGDVPLYLCKIEGCEYFMCYNSYGSILCHKGNCSNTIHKRGNK